MTRDPADRPLPVAQAAARKVLRTASTVRPSQDGPWIALRAGVTLAVPLTLLLLLDRTDLTLYPTFGAFAAVYGRDSQPHRRLVTRLQAGAWLSLCVTAGAGLAIAPGRAWIVIPAAATVAGIGTELARRLAWQPPGALFAVFAVAACASVPGSAARVVDALALSVGTVAVSVLLGLPAVWRARTRPPAGREPAPPIAPRSGAPAIAAGAVLLAGLTTTGLSWNHPYWAMVAAVAATTGPTTTARIARGVQRVAGTLVGLVVAAAVLATHPVAAVSVALAVLFQMITELVVGRNYAIALVFVTPLAILMVELGRPQDPGTLLRDRAIETVVGAVCGIVVTVTAHAVRARLEVGTGRSATARGQSRA